MASIAVQWPPVLTSLQTAPHSKLEASVVIRRSCLPCEIGLYALSMFLTQHCSSALAAALIHQNFRCDILMQQFYLFLNFCNTGSRVIPPENWLQSFQ